MLAIANELETRGAEVLMAGGGAGAAFVSLNGYDEFEPTVVDYVDTYQTGPIRRVAAESVPASIGRVTDYVAWLRETDPDALVTDDMFAAMAASRTDVPLYVLKHDMPDLYHDRLERSGAALHTKFQLGVAREFFYPVVCPPSDIDPTEATRVPPVALDGEAGEIDAADVVCVPSQYSDFDRVAAALERTGYDVLNVGDDDWDAVPSLLPYLRGADVVVCSGYSTIMDAAVAGTPCVIAPATDEQEAVAEWIDDTDTTGFTIAEGPLDILDAVDSPPATPAFGNGAGRIAATVLDDLTETAAQEAAAAQGAAAEQEHSSLENETIQPADDRDSFPQPATLTTALRSHLFGRRERAIGTSLCAVWMAVLVAHQVAARNGYTLIEQSLPTYSGSVGGPFLVGAVLLVGLAAFGARFGAGLVSSVLLASSPVVGWAVTHWTVPMTTHYVPTFPLEMAALYGGVFGTLGYLLGVGLGKPPDSRGTTRSGARMR